jgi:hypothetical protein
VEPQKSHKLDVRLPDIAFAAALQVFGIDQALNFSLDDVLQHALIRTEISYQLLEFAILLFGVVSTYEVLRRPSLRTSYSIDRTSVQTPPQFSRDICHRGTLFCLPKNKGDLLFGILFSLHNLDPSKREI